MDNSQERGFHGKRSYNAFSWSEIRAIGVPIGGRDLEGFAQALDEQQIELFKRRPILGGYKWLLLEALELPNGEVALKLEDGHIEHYAIILRTAGELRLVWEAGVK